MCDVRGGGKCDDDECKAGYFLSSDVGAYRCEGKYRPYQSYFFLQCLHILHAYNFFIAWTVNFEPSFFIEFRPYNLFREQMFNYFVF